MSEPNVVDGTKLMDVVFTVSGGVYGMVKDKVNTLYTSGVLAGSLPKGAIVTGVVFNVVNDSIKISIAYASGDDRALAKAVVSTIIGDRPRFPLSTELRRPASADFFRTGHRFPVLAPSSAAPPCRA